jgi:transcriptional regulator with XRE-family HTH domain
VTTPAERVRSLRTALKLKQSDVAIRSGSLPQTTILKIEKGRNKATSYAVREALGRSFGLSTAEMSDFLDGRSHIDQVLETIRARYPDGLPIAPAKEVEPSRTITRTKDGTTSKLFDIREGELTHHRSDVSAAIAEAFAIAMRVSQEAISGRIDDDLVDHLVKAAVAASPITQIVDEMRAAQGPMRKVLAIKLSGEVLNLVFMWGALKTTGEATSRLRVSDDGSKLAVGYVSAEEPVSKSPEHQPWHAALAAAGNLSRDDLDAVVGSATEAISQALSKKGAANPHDVVLITPSSAEAMRTLLGVAGDAVEFETTDGRSWSVHVVSRETLTAKLAESPLRKFVVGPARVGDCTIVVAAGSGIANATAQIASAGSETGD